MRALVVGLASVVVLGCAHPDSRPGPAAADLVTAGVLATSLEVGITRDEVRFSLHVTNLGDSPLRFAFPTAQRYDFVVESAAGEEVWRWSAGRSFAQVVTEAELAPGESWSFEAGMPAEGRSGRHVVVGRLVSLDGGLAQAVMFDLP